MSNASGDDEELKALLSNLEVAAASAEVCECFANDCKHERLMLEVRQSVESLFGRIREELKEAGEDAAQYDALREAYEQLEASHLSPEEARCAVGLLWGMAGTDFEKAIVEKLRSISGGALKEGATQ